MNVELMLLISTIALVFCVMLIFVLAVLWFRAERKIYRLGGESKYFKEKKKENKK